MMNHTFTGRCVNCAGEFKADTVFRVGLLDVLLCPKCAVLLVVGHEGGMRDPSQAEHEEIRRSPVWDSIQLARKEIVKVPADVMESVKRYGTRPAVLVSEVHVWIQVCSLVQTALRHPQVAGPVRETGISFVIQVADALEMIDPALAEAVKVGMRGITGGKV